ncbi:MAG: 1,2-phenylacetyl-CoA epoxidase subunit PaaD, partial [Bacteroidota bacterium]
EALDQVFDPEIPVLSVMDMGVIRSIKLNENKVEIDLTPTYSGCPAMDTLAVDIKLALEEIGMESKINLVLSPAWTTDWITERGRKALEDYGIASPLNEEADKMVLLDGARLVTCPQCNSTNTKMISQFGSTACKALFKCESCLEPFDYFKCLK